MGLVNDLNAWGATVKLEELRDKLTQLDDELIRLIGARQDIVDRIGAHKLAAGRATRDYQREKEVLDRGRSHASTAALDPDLAEAVLRLLIRYSLTSQEHARVVAEGQGGGRSALVIGGRGKMGRWFAGFLSSQGYRVDIADPDGPLQGYDHVTEWRASIDRYELIVVATPLGATSQVLLQLAELQPPGLIFDIGSLKTPLRESLAAVAAAGCRVTSVHPMFGPDTRLLSGRHVIFLDIGDREATGQAKALFASTMVQQIEMDIEDHDRVIAYVLGLSHALNIAFFTALAESGEAVPKLAELSSTTFDAQLGVAGRVATENPSMYFEIQALNDYGLRPLEALGDAVERITHLVRSGDEAGFVELMRNGRAYFDTRG